MSTKISTIPQVVVGNGIATALGTKTGSYIIVQAANANTDLVWIGGADVVAGSGIELARGQSAQIPIEDSAKLFVIANTSGQLAGGLAVTPTFAIGR